MTTNYRAFRKALDLAPAHQYREERSMLAICQDRFVQAYELELLRSGEFDRLGTTLARQRLLEASAEYIAAGNVFADAILSTLAREAMFERERSKRNA